MLKESEAGGKTDDICRCRGISSATFYSWRKKYGVIDESEAKRLRELEAENARLKRIVADQMLDMTFMKELLAKMYSPPRGCKLFDDGFGLRKCNPASDQWLILPARP